MSALKLRGVLPPMITPFTADGQVDYAAFRHNLEVWNQYPLSGYLVCGSNGETAYLSQDEKLRLVAITVETAAPGRTLMVGSGMEEPRATIDLTNRCADLGIQCALVLTPGYYSGAMSSAALIDFFTRVAEGSRIPILIYNVPKFTHVNIQADAVAALAQHPNIIGMKDSTGDVPQLASFLNATAGQDFTILVGTASAWYPALGLGISGGIHALANCLPAVGTAIQTAFEAGETERARAIYQVILPVNAAVTGGFGIAGLKHACDLNGLRGGQVRCPLQPLADSRKPALEGILATAGRQLAELGL